MSLLENYCPHAVTVGLGQHGSSIKAEPSPHSLIHSSSPHNLLENKVSLKLFYSFIYSNNYPSMGFFSTKLSLYFIPDSMAAFYGRGKGAKAVTWREVGAQLAVSRGMG